MTATLETRIAEARRELRSRSPRGVQRLALPAKLRAATSADGGYTITGHGAVYNTLSDNLGGFREQIQPGFFDAVLAKAPDTRLLFNHDPNLLLAGTRNGTLLLRSDSVGLGYTGQISPGLAATDYGSALRTLLDEGLVTQSSFAFTTAAGADSWDEDPETGGLIRTLLPNGCSGLFDVSPVTYPAYPAADSQLADDGRQRDGLRLVNARKRHEQLLARVVKQDLDHAREMERIEQEQIERARRNRRYAR